MITANRVAFTPGGPRLQSEVHLIAAGETLVVTSHLETMIRSVKEAGQPDQANWISAAWLGK